MGIRLKDLSKLGYRDNVARSLVVDIVSFSQRYLMSKTEKEMKKKKIIIVISYDYEDKNTVSNDRIADRVKNELLKGSNPKHEKIESVTVEDN